MAECSASAPITEYGYNNAEYKTPQYLLDGVERALAPLYAAGSRTLIEIGCGTGYTAARLAAKGWQVRATDISSDGIAIANSTYGESGVRFEAASIYDRDLSSRFGTFDVLLAIEVIEHLQLPRELLLRAAELLNPGGAVILTTPYHGYLKNLALSVTNRWDRHFAVEWDAGHVRFFSPAALTRMAYGCGFTKTHWRGLGRIPGLWKSFLFQAESKA